MSIQQERTTSDDELLAELDEEQQNIVQMQKVKRMTIEPGLMRVPVGTVTTAHNSEQWVIQMDHPIEDNIRFFLAKPAHGWTREYKIVRLLEDYGFYSENPYALQQISMYIEYDDDAEEWQLTQPPGERTIGDRLRDFPATIRESVPTMERTLLTLYAFILTGSILGGIMQEVITTPVDALVAPALMLLFTLLGLVVSDP